MMENRLQHYEKIVKIAENLQILLTFPSIPPTTNPMVDETRI